MEAFVAAGCLYWCQVWLSSGPPVATVHDCELASYSNGQIKSFSMIMVHLLFFWFFGNVLHVHYPTKHPQTRCDLSCDGVHFLISILKWLIVNITSLNYIGSITQGVDILAFVLHKELSFLFVSYIPLNMKGTRLSSRVLHELRGVMLVKWRVRATGFLWFWQRTKTSLIG